MKHFIASERCESEWVNCTRGIKLDKNCIFLDKQDYKELKGFSGSEVHLGGRMKVIDL